MHNIVFTLSLINSTIVQYMFDSIQHRHYQWEDCLYSVF